MVARLTMQKSERLRIVLLSGLVRDETPVVAAPLVPPAPLKLEAREVEETGARAEDVEGDGRRGRSALQVVCGGCATCARACLDVWGWALDLFVSVVSYCLTNNVKNCAEGALGCAMAGISFATCQCEKVAKNFAKCLAPAVTCGFVGLDD